MRRVLPSILLLALAAGCDGPAATSRGPGESAVAEGSQIAEVSSPIRIVMLGDSITAGYGLPEEQAFPALIEGELRRRGWAVEVVNAGVSGDTTAGGRARLGWLLQQRPQVLLVGLGANDGLRGLPVDEVESNLRNIVTVGREAGARVVLLGMQVPPNYGAEYAARFAAVYPELAADLEVPLVPFLLEGVGGRAHLNLPDGIHPNAEGHRIIASHLVSPLEEVLHEVLAEEPA